MSDAGEPLPGPRRLVWQGEGPYAPLLEGPPGTRGMRSGRVSLKAGEEVGEHSTGAHEEIVIVVKGRGRALARGREPIDIQAGQAVYVPPHTVHNMQNADAPLFEYLFVVAPVPEAGAGATPEPTRP